MLDFEVFELDCDACGVWHSSSFLRKATYCLYE